MGYMLKEEKGMGRRGQWNKNRKKDKNVENWNLLSAKF